MSLIDRATIRPNAGNWTAAQELVRIRADHVENARQSLETSIAYAANAQAAFDRAGPVLNQLINPEPTIDDSVLQMLRAYLEHPWYRLRSNAEDALSSIQDNRTAVERCERELAAARARAAAIPEPTSIVVTQEAVEQRLKDFKARWARFYQNAAGETELRFTLFDILMKVSPTSDYGNWFKSIGTPTIKLPPVTCVINFERNRIHFVPLRSELMRYPRGMSQMPIAHPHVPNNSGDPCLGDFAHIWAEAVSSGDIGFMASTAIMFLSKADGRDSAGRHYYRYLLGGRALDDGDVGSSYCKFDGRYYYVLVNDQGHYKLWSAEHRASHPWDGNQDATELTVPPSDYDAHDRELDRREDLFIDAYLRGDYSYIMLERSNHTMPPLVSEHIPQRVNTAQPNAARVTVTEGLPEGALIEEVW